MPEEWVRDGTGSFHNYLPPGCEICRQGASLVLFITGECARECFYCPLSKERRGRDLIFANERAVSSPHDILEEARAIDALGTGITGGEPLLRLDLVLDTIRMLKRILGKEHHIHLYTGIVPVERVLSRLRDAGLDELRMHPDLEREEPRLAEALKSAMDLGIEAGVEIPAIAPAPWIAEAVQSVDAFLNINELEFTETNADALRARGFRAYPDSCAAIGSESIARSFMHYRIKLHYCSSVFKDSVQLRERLKRRAGRVRREFDIVSNDGTLLTGVIVAPDPQAAIRVLEELGVPESMYELAADGIEIAAWILEEIADEVRHIGSPHIVERYPTEDGLVVERIPL
ncbi:MAG TPA: radical SAM protein [Methanothrix sp.]|nr:radical SAM protein [Methanothrix sp.]HOK58839.1 radical SAM protein [Methanothrix sp.]HOL42779.1 radical SAM protein [Methanothrix sp.]HPO89038.1 radical SAM protein [Methanothrix sp.]